MNRIVATHGATGRLAWQAPVIAMGTADRRRERNALGASADAQAWEALPDSPEAGPAHFVSFDPGRLMADRDRNP
jgi:hypothetical protein